MIQGDVVAVVHNLQPLELLMVSSVSKAMPDEFNDAYFPRSL